MKKRQFQDERLKTDKQKRLEKKMPKTESKEQDLDIRI